MSETTYKVPYTTILDIQRHPNADKLDICTVYGFQVVAQRDKYKIGNEVLYVPIDSILTQELEDIIFPPGSKIKLDKHRVRQIRIRGTASQGMLINKEDLKTLIDINSMELEKDYSKELNITKYEPPFVGLSQPQGKDKQRNKSYEHPLFHKYNGLESIKWFPTLFKEGEEVVINEKLHGCVQSKTKIRLSDGTSKTIKEIVDNKLNVKVLGLNCDGKLVESKILNWFNNGKTNRWLRIVTSREKAGRGNYVSNLTCTENHEFYSPTNNSYIRADKLVVGQKISLLREDFDLSFIQTQVLIGKMLGDASLSGDKKNYISFSHSKTQEEYLDYTLQMLGTIAGNKTTETISGYGTTMCRARTVSRDEIRILFSNWFISNKKEVPNDITLSPISLAFWYMDDGSLQHNDNQEDRITLATCSFSEESCYNLIVALNKLGINATLKCYDYNRLYINADNSDKFFVLIAPYVPLSMQYKIPEKYRVGDRFFVAPKFRYKPEITVQTIINIELDTSHSYSRYDLETETHNYFANNILTHNSNARASLLPYNANTTFKKILKFLKLAPKAQKCYGSNNVQKQVYQGRKKHFYEDDVWANTFNKLDVFNKLKLGETVFGEIIGPGIQANYDYGLKEHRFVLFDVKVLQSDGTQIWLKPDAVEQFAKERGFEYVPVVYKGPYNKELAYSLTKGPSLYDPKTKVREGIVIKAKEGYNVDGNKRALKWVSEDYLDDKNNTDFH